MPRVPKKYFSERFRALPFSQKLALRRKWNSKYRELQPRVNTLLSEHDNFKQKVMGKEPKKDMPKLNDLFSRAVKLSKEIITIERAIKPFLPKDFNLRHPVMRIEGPLYLELKFHQLFSELRELQFEIESEQKWAWLATHVFQ